MKIKVEAYEGGWKVTCQILNVEGWFEDMQDAVNFVRLLAHWA